MKYGWLVLFVPVALAAIGGLSNAIVCVSNGGQMPVYPVGGCPVEMDWNHICMTAHTHLNWLGDWMVSNHAVSSPGDWLIDIGQDIVPASWLAWLGLTLQNLKRGQ